MFVYDLGVFLFLCMFCSAVFLELFVYLIFRLFMLHFCCIIWALIVCGFLFCFVAIS